MPKKTVTMIQKIIIEYGTDTHLKEAINSIKDNPNCYSTGGAYWRWIKHPSIPKINHIIKN